MFYFFATPYTKIYFPMFISLELVINYRKATKFFLIKETNMCTI